VLEAQGKLTEAQGTFEEALAISRRLAELDPNNTGWQSGLAATLSLLGGVLEVRGKLAEAKAAIEEGMAINRRLADLDSNNTGWQSQAGGSRNGGPQQKSSMGD
jgi:Flp pilus assembly protein TadD